MKGILDVEIEGEISKPLIKVKHILILFLLGWIVYQVGALFKIQSWEHGSLLILLGTFIKVLSAFLGIIKLASIKEVKSFLNR